MDKRETPQIPLLIQIFMLTIRPSLKLAGFINIIKSIAINFSVTQR
jgi:hypothetical protein